VLSRVEAAEVLVSGFGIREGLLLESARVSMSVADPGEARTRSVRAFAEKCRFEAPHAEQVQRLALQLYDAVGKRLGAEPGEREILSDAALLHDVGYHISYDKHHKHSYHLIMHAELLGMSPEEKVTVAHVARYHRGADPNRVKHRDFGQLDRETRRRIKRLSAILRVADGFDRGHVGAVDRLKVRWLERALRITPVAQPRASTLQLELWGAARKSALLAEVTGVPVEIVAPDGRVVTDSVSSKDRAGSA
jgi:exopolyphosphatase/guanosine-5'-triphosphate,3'-diphosphate pyrophosphatase